MAYLKLRLNGMSAFNATRVVLAMAQKGEELRAEDTVQVLTSLLEPIETLPDWLVRNFLNKESDLAKRDKNYRFYRLLDNDLNWLFVDVDGKAECICGYDGMHFNTSGFQKVFENITAKHKLTGLLTLSDAEMISSEIHRDFHVLWLHPLEIPLVFQ